MDIDIETGLPKLPGNFYWQIASTHKGSDYLEVRIMRKSDSIWRPDRKVENGVIRKEEATPEKIRSSARYAFQRFENFNFENDWQRYVGDYPPKSL